MTASQIYWVMQLDSVRYLLGFVALLGCLIGAIFASFYAIATTDIHPSKEGIKIAESMKKAATSLLAVGMTAWLACTFLPSSKTAAAMIVLPEITSDKAIDAVGTEAKEILELAKDALRGLGEKKKKNEVEQ